MPLTTSQSNSFSNSSWTMAIASQSSPLSRWWGQALEQVTEFRLEFKPQTESLESEKTESQQTAVVKGNSMQLEALSQLTESYVQNLLVKSVEPGSLATLDRPTATLPDDDPAFPGDMPEWQAEEGYRHRLYVGSLQVEPLMSELTVTTTQLHDLSEILQEAMLAAQPQTLSAFPRRSPAWPKTAAAAVAAIGLTSGVAWYVTGGGASLQTASEPDQELVSLDPAQPDNQNLDLPPNFPAQPTPPQVPNSDSQSKALPQTRKPNVVVPTTPNPTANQPSSSASPKDDADDAAQFDPKVAPKPQSESKAEKQEVTEQAVASTSEQKAVAADEGAANTSDAPENSGRSTSSPNSKPAPLVAAEAEPQQQPVGETRENVAVAPTLRSNELASAPRVSAPSVEGFTAKRAPAPPVISPETASEGVVTFFQSQWQGQDVLDQSLSYRIDVKPDGTVSSVTPKNNLASVQIEQTPVPPAGARLTPPFSSPNPLSFDVTLYPDGTVLVK